MKKNIIPLSVPQNKKSAFLKNMRLATAGSGRLFLFAGDQKVEHLNDDFYGPGISPADASPEHLFQIASAVPGAVLATHFGLLDRYGMSYSKLPYILKVNGKTNLDNRQDENYSAAWMKGKEINAYLKNSHLKIVGLGYTVYLGSNQEARMLKQASRVIRSAHENGLLAVIWIYPKRSNIKNEENPHLLAGASGVAAALGADFVKIKYPYQAKSEKSASAFQEAILAAGRTGVICAGGSRQEAKTMLKHLSRQLKYGSAGIAIGRNLHQRNLTEATILGKAIAAMLHDNLSLKEAEDMLIGKKTKIPKNKSRLLGLF